MTVITLGTSKASRTLQLLVQHLVHTASHLADRDPVAPIRGLSSANIVPNFRHQDVGVRTTMCIRLCMALQQRVCRSAATSARQTRTSQPSQHCNVAAVRFPSWLHSGEAAEMLAHFDQAVTGGAEGIEDDDEVQVDRGNDLAPNAACPITSKGVRLCPTLPHRTLQHKAATCDAECRMSTAFVVGVNSM